MAGLQQRSAAGEAPSGAPARRGGLKSPQGRVRPRSRGPLKEGRSKRPPPERWPQERERADVQGAAGPDVPEEQGHGPGQHLPGDRGRQLGHQAPVHGPRADQVLPPPLAILAAEGLGPGLRSGHLPELLGQKPSAAPRPALAGRGPPAAPAAMGSCASRDRADGADGAAADAGDGDAGSEAGRCVPPPPPPSPAPGRPQRKMRPRRGGRRCCCGPAPSLQPGPGPQQGWPPRQAAPPGPPAAKGTRLAPASSLPAPGRCGSGPGTGAAGGAASGPLPWHARPPNRPARAGADARRTGRPAGRRGSCGE